MKKQIRKEQTKRTKKIKTTFVVSGRNVLVEGCALLFKPYFRLFLLFMFAEF